MTNQNYTFEVLGGYLDYNNRVNAEYLADSIEVVFVNDCEQYAELLNNRRRARSLAIDWLMRFVNMELGFAGYKGYTATNAQVMNFDRQHGGGLERVLDNVTAYINDYRREAV